MWLWWSPMASEAFSYGLNSKIFLGEHAPRPPYHTLCYMRMQKTRAGCAHRMAAPNSLYVCPPLLQCLDLPLQHNLLTQIEGESKYSMQLIISFKKNSISSIVLKLPQKQPDYLQIYAFADQIFQFLMPI